MENCKPISTPLELGSKLIKDQSLNLEFSQKEKMVEIPYKSIVKSLMYAIVYTWLDIAIAMGIISQHLANLGNAHWSKLKGSYDTL